VGATTFTHDRLDLADFRRRVFGLYADVRACGSDDAGAVRRFRSGRNRLFAEHPQSPLDPDGRRTFVGLPYYPYDPSLRVTASLEPVRPDWDDGDDGRIEIPLRDDGGVLLERVATARFVIAGERVALTVFWIAGYGGGLFLPFGDATNSGETYGGGRYLLDTIKGADLGSVNADLLLDFNYAYNPSCAYSVQWVCPLAPPENRIDLPLRAGERFPTASSG
jgi:uncharacterized protein